MTDRDGDVDGVSLTDPKVVGAALAFGAKLVRTEIAQNGRLTFILAGVPRDFTTKILNDELTVSVRAYIAALESVLGMIAQHQRSRRP